MIFIIIRCRIAIYSSYRVRRNCMNKCWLCGLSLIELWRYARRRGREFRWLIMVIILGTRIAWRRSIIVMIVWQRWQWLWESVRIHFRIRMTIRWTSGVRWWWSRKIVATARIIKTCLTSACWWGCAHVVNVERMTHITEIRRMPEEEQREGREKHIKVLREDKGD